MFAQCALTVTLRRDPTWRMCLRRIRAFMSRQFITGTGIRGDIVFAEIITAGGGKAKSQTRVSRTGCLWRKQSYERPLKSPGVRLRNEVGITKVERRVEYEIANDSTWNWNDSVGALFVRAECGSF